MNGETNNDTRWADDNIKTSMPFIVYSPGGGLVSRHYRRETAERAREACKRTRGRGSLYIFYQSKLNGWIEISI